ncbi:MAG: glycosyltransferase family 2 protein [Chitinophagaceae bacterium]
MLHQIAVIFQYIILVFFIIQVAYLLFFSVVGKIVKGEEFPTASSLRRIRIFIPAYKEDAVIITTALDALRQDYPSSLFHVVIIADSCSEATLNTLRSLPITVIEVLFDKSTKGKALQQAILKTSAEEVDIVVVLDADNHMSPGFLHKINNAFEKGYEIVQGHRTAKDTRTAFAFLDACTEEINNHIFRRGHVAIGLPSALIGSGMAFKYNLFTRLLSDIGDTSGEDKELEFRIMREQKKVAFLDGAYVLDEKVAHKDVFSSQRSRWLAMQIEFLEKYFIEGWVQLFKGNISFFNKVFQTFLLPRVMLVAALLLWSGCVMVFMKQYILISSILVISLAGSLLLGIPKRWYNRKLLQAFLQIPGSLLSMFYAMANMGKARKHFIHTPHGQTDQNHL